MRRNLEFIPEIKYWNGYFTGEIKELRIKVRGRSEQEVKDKLLEITEELLLAAMSDHVNLT